MAQYRHRLASLFLLVLVGIAEAQPGQHSSELDFEPPKPRGPSPELNTAPADENPNILRRSWQYAEQKRDEMTETWLGWTQGIDSFLSGTESEAAQNKSYLKIELKSTFEESGEMESDARIKAKVDLPNTKRRLKLVFSSDDREEDTLEERVRPKSTGERVRKEESIAGLLFEPDNENRKWKRKVSAGVKFRSPPDPYVRFRVNRDWEMKDSKWSARFEEEVWYFDAKGWGSTAELEFIRPITENYSLSIFSGAEYRDEFDAWEFVQTLSTRHRLDKRSSIEYRLGLFGLSQPNPRLTSFFIGSSYRKLIHEDWVVMTFSPELFFPREENWSAEPSVTFRLEIFFTE